MKYAMKRQHINNTTHSLSGEKNRNDKNKNKSKLKNFMKAHESPQKSDQHWNIL